MLFILLFLLLYLVLIPFAHGAKYTRKNSVERLSSRTLHSCTVPCGGHEVLMAPVPEEWNCKLYLILISLTLNFNYCLWLVAIVPGSRALKCQESPHPAPSAPSSVSWWASRGAGVIVLS